MIRGILTAVALMFVVSACSPIIGNLYPPCDCNDVSN